MKIMIENDKRSKDADAWIEQNANMLTVTEECENNETK
jgi:hypothetical protein